MPLYLLAETSGAKAQDEPWFIDTPVGDKFSTEPLSNITAAVIVLQFCADAKERIEFTFDDTAQSPLWIEVLRQNCSCGEDDDGDNRFPQDVANRADFIFNKRDNPNFRCTTACNLKFARIYILV